MAGGSQVAALRDVPARAKVVRRVENVLRNQTLRAAAALAMSYDRLKTGMLGDVGRLTNK